MEEETRRAVDRYIESERAFRRLAKRPKEKTGDYVARKEALREKRKGLWKAMDQAIKVEAAS